MAKALISDELWSLIATHVPVHPPSPKGGRPRIGDRATLTGILFVLRTGIPWEYLPRDCKHHILVDQRGLPLVAQISGAQVHDSRLLVPIVEAIPAVKGLSGRARKRPGKLHADRAYASRAHRAWLRRRGIAARIARYGVESRERLGRWRWVVERTLGWLHRFRRLRIRYERRADIHQAFLLLACSLICWRYVDRYC